MQLIFQHFCNNVYAQKYQEKGCNITYQMYKYFNDATNKHSDIHVYYSYNVYGYGYGYGYSIHDVITYCNNYLINAISYFKIFPKYIICSFKDFSEYPTCSSIHLSILRSTLYKSSLSRFISDRITDNISESVIIHYPQGKYCLKQEPITHKAQAPKTHNIKVNLVPEDSNLCSLAKARNFKSISLFNILISSFVAIFLTIELILSSRRVNSSFVAILSETADIIVSNVLIAAKACSSDIPDVRNSLYRLIMSVPTIINSPLSLFGYIRPIISRICNRSIPKLEIMHHTRLMDMQGAH